jgi:hypothetical protein
MRVFCETKQREAAVAFNARTAVTIRAKPAGDSIAMSLRPLRRAARDGARDVGALRGLMMKTALLAAALLLTTAPAFAQVPVLTNADLGKHVPQRIVLTPEQWQSLVAHQFVYVPSPRHEWGGARVTIIPDSTPHPYIPPTYPLQPPFYMSTSVGPYFGPYAGYSLYREHFGARRTEPAGRPLDGFGLVRRAVRAAHRR